MTNEEAFVFIRSCGKTNYSASLSFILKKGKYANNANNELVKVLQGVITSINQLSVEAKVSLQQCAQDLQNLLNPPSATTQETYFKKNGNECIRIVNSKGDNSSQLASYENRTGQILTFANDLLNGKYTPTSKIEQNDADNSIAVGGDNAKDVSGANHTRAGESSAVTTSPNVVQNNPVAAANAARKEITAAKSSFNDNRENDGVFAIIDEFLSIPEDIFKAITKVEKKDDEAAEETGEAENENIFVSIVDDVTKELGKITKAYSMFTSKSAAEKAKAVIKNKKEKIKKAEERIKKMKEGPKKDKLLTALMTMDFSKLFADPANENKDKKSIRDKDEEVNMAVKATEKALTAEANIN